MNKQKSKNDHVNSDFATDINLKKNLSIFDDSIWKKSQSYWKLFFHLKLNPTKLWWWKSHYFDIKQDFDAQGKLTLQGRKKLAGISKNDFKAKFASKLIINLDEQLKMFILINLNTFTPWLKTLNVHFNDQIKNINQWEAAGIKFSDYFDQKLFLKAEAFQNLDKLTFLQKTKLLTFKSDYFRTKLFDKLDHHFKINLPSFLPIIRWIKILEAENEWLQFKLPFGSDLESESSYRAWINSIIYNFNFDFKTIANLTNQQLLTQFQFFFQKHFGNRIKPFSWLIKLFPEKLSEILPWLSKKFINNSASSLYDKGNLEVINEILAWKKPQIKEFVEFGEEKIINFINDEVWIYINKITPLLKIYQIILPDFFKQKPWTATNINFPDDWTSTWKPWSKLRWKQCYNSCDFQKVQALININYKTLHENLIKNFKKHYHEKIQPELFKLSLLPNQISEKWFFLATFKMQSFVITTKKCELKEEFFKQILPSWTPEQWWNFWYNSPNFINIYFEKIWLNHWKIHQNLFQKSKKFNISLAHLSIWKLLNLNWFDDIDSDGLIKQTSLKSFFVSLSAEKITKFLNFSFNEVEKKIYQKINEKYGGNLKKTINWQEIWENLYFWFNKAKIWHFAIEEILPFKLFPLDWQKDLDKDNFLTQKALEKLNNLSNLKIVEIRNNLDEAKIKISFLSVWKEAIFKTKILEKLLIIKYDFDSDVKWKDVDLDFKKVFDNNGKLLILEKEWLKNWNDKQILNLLKFNVNYLTKIFNNYSYQHIKKLLPIFKNFLDINFPLQKISNLSKIDLDITSLPSLKDLSPEIWQSWCQKNNVDPLAIMNITIKDLKKVFFDHINHHWNAFAKNLALIKKLSLLFANQDLWLNLQLNWQTDLKKDGFLTDEALQKLWASNINVWKAVLEINSKKIAIIIDQQINHYWLNLQPLLQKIWVIEKDFFKKEAWINIGIDVDNQGKIFSQPLIKPIKNLTFVNLQNLIKLHNFDLQKKLQTLLTEKWQELQPLFRKILIFDRNQLFNLPELKKINFDWIHGIDSDINLKPPQKEQMIYWSLKRWQTFFALTIKRLKQILIKLVEIHWKNLQSVIYTAKLEKINLSDHNFWIETNISWQTDLEKSGALKASTLQTIFIKTENQFKAISKLSKKTLFHIYQTKKISVSKAGVVISLTFGQKLINFFKNIFTRKKHLFPNDFVRLQEAQIINNNDYLQPINNFKQLRNQQKNYNFLRKKYSKRIIYQGEIVGLVKIPVDLKINIIELNNVSKYYLIDKNINQTLHNIDLTIKRGDFVVILGPSGAGKSSLLNLLSGIDSPETGDVFINGINLTLLNSGELTEFRRKYVGFVFQKYNLLANLTAKENVELSEALLPDFKPAIELNELFQFLEIDKFIDKYPFQLSGGQQQRFSIARALVKNPDILFCDEPTGSLDQKMSLKVMKTLMHINDKYQTTIIIVTHDQSFVQIAKTVIHFNDGVINNIYQNKTRLDPYSENF